MNLIDSHCHLPDLRHRDELEKILTNAKSWQVAQVIDIGTSLKENAAAVEVAKKYPAVFATVGIYPHEQRNEPIEKLIAELEIQAKSTTKIVAIGECGIDLSNWKYQRPPEDQLELFEQQIILAQKLNLPLVIHNRRGDEAILSVLQKHHDVRGVIHCFDSTWEVADQFLHLGLYLSFSGLITYDANSKLLETVRKIPADQYLLETDSPYLLPEPAKSAAKAQGVKQKNEPGYVRMVGQKVAEIRETSLEIVAEQTANNTRMLFGI
ncbi:TatD family hydrolase [Patescibacteria group bacterium]|nr:TatD family hydrolase [Patescibacteria group bacterium]